MKTNIVTDEDDNFVSVEYQSSLKGGNHANVMSLQERRKKRLQKKRNSTSASDSDKRSRMSDTALADSRISELLARDEDELLNFVAKINKVYQDKLKKPAPFMTFVFCGMQSAGKSTIMERFMNAVLNIVQEGTGTRCPLDTTCIHDSSLDAPVCELSGEELEAKNCGDNLSMSQVFQRITELNKKLGREDRFSTKPIYLVYRAKNVQNMRFVDTPGIISNKSTGKDNREDIKTILRSEMKKPNTKLCVLLEPKEFATNPIIEFCDSSLGGREKWIGDATFLMTKFDKQLDDSRSGSKANAFFQEFYNNKCFPHLVITPTLAKEDLPSDKLFKARKELLSSADQKEFEKFEAWQDGHRSFHAEQQDELLDPRTSKKIGFASAKKVMREIMLEDTARRLPEVLQSLRNELTSCQKELKVLEEKLKFSDPKELKSIVGEMFVHIEKRVSCYLSGDLESAMKFPERLQTLEEEIEEEEESEWASKELNHYTEREDYWRERIANLAGDYPEEVQADNKFLGGKQYQRAIEFFRAIMVEALPDPYQLKDKIANATGYMNDGLHRENWEHAIVEITKVCMKDVSHPGINYLVKHVGSIFRRLFTLALDDIKQGERFSATFQLIPSAVEKFLVNEFENMVWELMVEASDKTHCSLEPMYSTIDPDLPTFQTTRVDDKGPDEDYYVIKNGAYVKVKNGRERVTENWTDWALRKMSALSSGSGAEAKSFLKKEGRERAMSKKSFLPDERTSMITSSEISTILQRSFEYIVALMDFNLYILKFQLNHYLYEGFKTELSRSFVHRINNADWNALIQPDPAVKKRMEILNDQIRSLCDSLKEVQTMYRRM